SLRAGNTSTIRANVILLFSLWAKLGSRGRDDNRALDKSATVWQVCPMPSDVARLISYYKSPLGRISRTLVRDQIVDLAGDVSGRRVLGLGFATPYLRFALKPAERVLAFMPARQGASAWPRE